MKLPTFGEQQTPSMRLQRTSAGEQVQHMRPGDRIAKTTTLQHVKQAFAHPVGGGAQMRPGIALTDRGEGDAAELSGDYSQSIISAFMSVSGSAIMSGPGDLPPSMSRLPIM